MSEMDKRQLILLFIFLLPAFRSGAQTVNSDERLRQIISRQGQVEVTIPLGNNLSVELLTKNVSILTVKDNVVHISLSPLTVEWFILQSYDYKIIEEKISKGILSSANLKQAMDWDIYPTYSQYDSIMRNFQKLYPALCRLDTIGTSVNGRLVLALKISDNVDIHEDEPAVFYSSTMHGDETGGFILMLHLADFLLKNYDTDNRVKELVDNLEIWINPLANPDGTYTTGNTITSPIRYNANGFDLNRNFPDPVTPVTVKQKETLDMVKFMRKHRFVLSANFHSGSEVVNYPWDRYLSKFHTDDAWFHSISRSYADTVHNYAGPAYMNFLENGVTRGAVWYIVYGGRQDFITGELQGREVTIELDDQFVTPASQLTLLWQNNWHSLLGYLENALYGIHGKVRNINSLVPVSAKVFIKGYDRDSSQVYSDSLTGSFQRFLNPGLWDLSFSATGYHDTTVTNVNLVWRQKTDLVVDMRPLINGIEPIDSSTTLILYPNPAGNELNALLPDVKTGNVNIKIINLTGKLISDYNTLVFQGTPLRLNINSLSSGTYIVVFKIGSASHRGRFVIVK
jgi:hypothetical protein